MLKSRLVTKDFTQKHGIDYKEIFAPIAKIATVRLFFTLIAYLNLEIEQIDIITAFLYSLLK